MYTLKFTTVYNTSGSGPSVPHLIAHHRTWNLAPAPSSLPVRFSLTDGKNFL